MSTTITTTDLKPGDVFLYQGTSLVARLIRLFDGTEYSHASIYDGAKVAEALSQGITTNTVADSVAGSNFVDVYRFISADKHHLGDTGYPAAKVIARVKNTTRNIRSPTPTTTSCSRCFAPADTWPSRCSARSCVTSSTPPPKSSRNCWRPASSQ